MFKRTAISGLVIGSVLIAGAAHAGPNPTPAPASQSVDESTIELRESLGLESDPEYVAKLSADKTADTKRLGIPLTTGESKEREARSDLAEKSDDVEKLVDPTGTYGGTYIDNLAGGDLVVNTTAPLPEVVNDSLTSLVGAARLVVKEVPYTYDYLVDVSNQIATSPLWQQGYATKANLNTETNAIEVSFLDTAPANAEDLWRATFGPSLTFSRDGEVAQVAAGRDQTSGPLYGGQWLNGAGGNCTTGYSNVRDSVGRYYTLSAGHCFPNGTIVRQGKFDSNGRGVGYASSNSVRYGGSTNCDCVPIGEIPGGTGTEQTRVNYNNLFRYTNANRQAVRGEVVCHSGASTFEAQGEISCGGVTAATGQQLVGGPDGRSFTLTDRVEVAFRVELGDSGGPVGMGSTFLGMVSYRLGPALGGYSKAQNVGTVNVRLGF